LAFRGAPSDGSRADPVEKPLRCGAVERREEAVDVVAALHARPRLELEAPGGARERVRISRGNAIEKGVRDRDEARSDRHVFALRLFVLRREPWIGPRVAYPARLGARAFPQRNACPGREPVQLGAQLGARTRNSIREERLSGQSRDAPAPARRSAALT
jgi:hypothetical protein